MTSKELVQRALSGLPVPRPAVGPLAVHYCANLEDAITTHEVVFAALRSYESGRPVRLPMTSEET